MPADQQRDHERNTEDKLERGPEHRHQPSEQQTAADVFLVGALEGGDLRFFLREGADEACAGEVLLRLRGDVREHRLNALETRMDARPKVLDQD